MNPLAAGHEKSEKGARQVASSAGPDPLIILRNLPGIAEIERLTRGQGEWLTEEELQQRIDPVSVALFGVTESDTRREWPDAWSMFPDQTSLEVTPDQQALIDAASAEVDRYEEQFDLLYDDDGEPADMSLLVPVFTHFGIDVTGEDQKPLRCLASLNRQIFACAGKLMPAAKFTPDGSGRRGAAYGVSAEEWGAAIEREARQFKASK